jgi:hypothetical protein
MMYQWEKVQGWKKVGDLVKCEILIFKRWKYDIYFFRVGKRLKCHDRVQFITVHFVTEKCKLCKEKNLKRGNLKDAKIKN